MNYSDYRISLDVRNIGSPIALECKKRETKIRIYITLLEGIKPYAISDKCTAVFTAKKPDGNILFNNCSREDNFIVYTFTPQTTTAVGVVNCEIRLYGKDNDLLISASFRLLVHDAVYDDGDEIESTSEVTTLTSLISEATTLISTVNSKLENGDFVPKLEIGEVKTLPAGSNATASITGTGEAPILNLGIPQGDEGQAEGMIPDAELSLESTKPVQNKVITAALNEKANTKSVVEALDLFGQALNLKADAETVNQALNQKADAEAINQALNQKADAEEVNSALDNKVDKVTGKGLSTNDFTNEEKNKLAGIEAGANKFVLNDGAVTAAKIKNGAVSQSVAVTLPAASWVDNAQTVSVAAVTADNTVIISPAPAADNFAAYTGNEVRCTAQAEGTLCFACESVPSADITVNVTVINK